MSRRERPPPFLTAEWRHLAMVNYEVRPATLAPHVPPGTELDDWNGTVFVTMVGFLFLQTRLRGVPIPFHRDFEEVNLRLYVRRRADDGWRRGVVFVREIVPRRAVAIVARRVYHEHYLALPMRHWIDAPESGGGSGGASYEWRQGRNWNRLTVAVAGHPVHPAAGSLADFTTQHYWGYARGRHGATLEYHVSHPPWAVWSGATARLTCPSAPQLYGAALAEPLAGVPATALLAAGSDVAVYPASQL